MPILEMRSPMFSVFRGKFASSPFCERFSINSYVDAAAGWTLNLVFPSFVAYYIAWISTISRKFEAMRDQVVKDKNMHSLHFQVKHRVYRPKKGGWNEFPADSDLSSIEIPSWKGVGPGSHACATWPWTPRLVRTDSWLKMSYSDPLSAYLKHEGREVESKSHWNWIVLMAVPSDRLSICLEHQQSRGSEKWKRDVTLHSNDKAWNILKNYFSKNQGSNQKNGKFVGLL